MRKWAWAVIVICGGIGGAIALNGDPNPADVVVRGNVLQPGQTVEASNKFGQIKISYLSATERKFEWDGMSRTVHLIARQEPFLGELGLYDPADCLFICLHTPRLVTRESVINFHSYEEIYQFLYQGSAVMDWVYTSDGLVAGFGRSPERVQANVSLYQILLDGKKPYNLRGARNSHIRMSRA